MGHKNSYLKKVNFKSTSRFKKPLFGHLQESTGAKIVIIQETADFANEKPLRITGSPESVERAKNMVTEILNQNDVSEFVRQRFKFGSIVHLYLLNFIFRNIPMVIFGNLPSDANLVQRNVLKCLFPIHFSSDFLESTTIIQSSVLPSYYVIYIRPR